MRLCKLVTCRLTLFHLMDFQSVVIGFAGSQILSFGVNLIICHQFLIYFFLFTIAFYTHVVHHSKVSAGFPAKTQAVLVSVHSYNVSPYYFPVGLSTNLTAFAFLRNPLSSKELGLTHVQLTINTPKVRYGL